MADDFRDPGVGDRVARPITNPFRSEAADVETADRLIDSNPPPKGDAMKMTPAQVKKASDILDRRKTAFQKIREGKVY